MIKKRNLDNSLIQWIMTTTGLGPGIGDLTWVAPATSSTSKYRVQLQDDMGVDNIFTTITAAEDNTIAYNNDVVLVMPGAYLEAAELGWDKQAVHMIGLGGPNHGGDYSEPNVAIYTTGTAVATVLNLTAPNCIFKNITFQNAGANAACLSAAIINSYGAWFEGCNISGNMQTAQNAVVAASSLYIAGAGMYPVFKDCQIGQDVWGKRTTANAGVIRFTGTARPNGGDFINCRIVSVAEGTDCAMVAVPADTAIGRGWRFDNCIFENFDHLGTTGALLTTCFYFTTPATTQDWSILLHNCSLFGVDEWTTSDHNIVMASMSDAGTAGGIGVNPTA